MSTAPDDRLAEPIVVTLDAVPAFRELGVEDLLDRALAEEAATR